jgi:hypothetical protein
MLDYEEEDIDNDSHPIHPNSHERLKEQYDC